MPVPPCLGAAGTPLARTPRGQPVQGAAVPARGCVTLGAVPQLAELPARRPGAALWLREQGWHSPGPVRRPRLLPALPPRPRPATRLVPTPSLPSRTGRELSRCWGAGDPERSRVERWDKSGREG